MSSDKLFLIDAHALCYRSFYAIRGLATSKGQPTNAVYGFINTLKKIIREYHPQYMAVCFDSPKKTYRQQKYAQYKIQRPPMPDDLISQIPIIKDVVRAYNIPFCEMGGFEADDIIATYCQQASDNQLDVVIVTEDKDMYQLVNNHVSIFSARNDKMLDYDQIKEKLGFEPQKMVDFIALAGDKSDNIPGVIGVGEVSARNLIQEFGALDKIYKNVESIKSKKLKEKLSDQRESAYLSKELAILSKSVPFQLDLEQLKVADPDNKELFELFKNLEFKKLANEVATGDQGQIDTVEKKIKTSKDIQDLIKKITKNKKFSFLFSDSVDSQELFNTQIGICIGQDDICSMDISEVASLKPVFEDANITKITHDLKKCCSLFQDNDVSIEGEVFDVKLAAYLLAPSTSSYSVSDLAWDYLKFTIDQDALTSHLSLVLFRLYDLMQDQLQSRDLFDLYKKTELPLSYVLFRMEKEGVCLDLKLLKNLSAQCNQKIEELTGKLYDLAGEEFNLNSPKQLSKILFEKLELPVIKKTKTGFSTDEGVLTKLAIDHAFPAYILEYRQMAKLKSTYIDALPKLIDENTKRIHASFNQTGTETGRLSSSNPNLQNIPIRTQMGKQIRKAIVPSKDRILLAADYSQIELRFLAHLSKDESLIKAFKTDQDIHTFTASLMFDIKEDDVTKEMRNSAKRVNFGIVYGMSAFGLSKDLNIHPAEAQEFIDRYFLRYPKVKEYMDKTIESCEKQGYVTTLLNRRRYIPEINSKNQSLKQFAQRQAINTPVQGSAADLIKLAMVNIQNEFDHQGFSSKMIITVHDELVFDLVDDEKSAVIDTIRKLMEGALKLSVPIKVSVKIGKNWLEMEEI